MYCHPSTTKMNQMIFFSNIFTVSHLEEASKIFSPHGHQDIVFERNSLKCLKNKLASIGWGKVGVRSFFCFVFVSVKLHECRPNYPLFNHYKGSIKLTSGFMRLNLILQSSNYWNFISLQPLADLLMAAAAAAAALLSSWIRLQKRKRAVGLLSETWHS